MCPCLADLGRFGNFGNGGDWYDHARSIGLPTSRYPQVGWLASFHVSPPFGDVGLIIGINNDGTITRWGANWHLDEQFSTDFVPADLITGCFLPPCECTGPTGQVISRTGATGQPQQATLLAARCQTFIWDILGGKVCFDGFIATIAMFGGVALLVAGAIIVAVWTVRNTTAGREVAKSTRAVSDVAPRSPQRVRQAPTGRRSAEETAASRQRVQASRVRAAARRRPAPTPTRRRAASREEAMQALRENRQLTPEQARALGATEVPKE